MALLTWRFIEVAWQLWTGKIELIIASHEVEDLDDTMADHPIGED